jgi:hypothetical protein
LFFLQIRFIFKSNFKLIFNIKNIVCSILFFQWKQELRQNSIIFFVIYLSTYFVKIAVKLFIFSFLLWNFDIIRLKFLFTSDSQQKVIHHLEIDEPDSSQSKSIAVATSVVRFLSFPFLNCCNDIKTFDFNVFQLFQTKKKPKTFQRWCNVWFFFLNNLTSHHKETSIWI